VAGQEARAVQAARLAQGSPRVEEDQKTVQWTVFPTSTRRRWKGVTAELAPEAWPLLSPPVSGDADGPGGAGGGEAVHRGEADLDLGGLAGAVSGPGLPDGPAVVPGGAQGFVSGDRGRGVRLPGSPVPADGDDRGGLPVWLRISFWTILHQLLDENFSQSPLKGCQDWESGSKKNSGCRSYLSTAPHDAVLMSHLRRPSRRERSPPPPGR
jgi:hypothetical protein